MQPQNWYFIARRGKEFLVVSISQRSSPLTRGVFHLLKSGLCGLSSDDIGSGVYVTPVVSW